ncbi:Chlorate reductase assembly chaperone protein [Phycisphaerae bacterium RAS2]|nr:Chlorate reductase assembly chaperone protein [Phycisphaerae bacterium RAS2]
MSDLNATPTRSDASDWVAAATLARLLAACFCAPQTAARLARGASTLRREALAAAERLGFAADRIRALCEEAKSLEDDERAFDRVIGHTVRSECTPYELEYRAAEIFQASQTLADLAGFYRAFGFEIAGPMSERPDHVTAQWEFVAILCMKAAFAPRDADRDCCVDALRSFLADHAATWMPAFHSRLRKADACSFLARAADLGDDLLRSFCARLDVSIGPSWLEFRPASEEDDATISCGAPGAVELGPNLAAAMEARA